MKISTKPAICAASSSNSLKDIDTCIFSLSIYEFGVIFWGNIETHYSDSKANVLTGHKICSLTNWDNANRLQQIHF